MPKSVKRVVKNSFFQTFGAFAITALNFLLMLGYARILGPENLGSLVTSQAQVLVWTILVELGLSHSIIGALTSAEGGKTELARQGFRARDLLFRVLLLRFAGAGIGTGAIFFLALSNSSGDENQFWQDMAFAPHLFALAIQQTAFGFAMFRHRQGLAVFSTLLGILVTVVLALWLATLRAPIGWLLLAQSWGGFLSGGMIFGYFFLLSFRRRRSGASRRIVRNNSVGPWGGLAWKALARDAWPYAITFGSFVIWQRLDQIAASKLLGLEQGGQYALAVRMVSIPIHMAMAISYSLFPDLQRLGRDTPERVQVVLGALVKAIWRYGIVAAAAVLAALGWLVVPLVPGFEAALWLLPYFLPGIWAFWMQSILVNALFGLRQYRVVVGVHLKSLFIYVPSLYILTLQFGLHGVAWSFNIFCLSMCFFGYISARKIGALPRGFRLYGAYSSQERALWQQACFGMKK